MFQENYQFEKFLEYQQSVQVWSIPYSIVHYPLHLWFEMDHTYLVYIFTTWLLFI